MTDRTRGLDAGEGDADGRADPAGASADAAPHPILESAHEAYIAIDAAGRITGWNLEAERTFGWSAAEVGGRQLGATIVPESMRAAHQSGLTELAAGGPARVLGKRLELTALHREGHEFPVELTIARHQAEPDGPMSFHAFLHDISARRLTERLRAVMQSVTRTMARAQSPEAAMGAVLDTLGTEMGWQLGAWWAHGEDGRLHRAAVWRAAPEVAPEFERSTAAEIGADEGFTGWAAAQRRPVWVQDFVAGVRFPHRATLKAAGLHAAIGFPVTRGERLLGVLECFTDSLRVSDSSIAEALEPLGEQVGELLGIVEERQALMSRLEQQALTDEVTGLPNRRAWERGLARELARAAREGHPVCVVALDIDGFKHFNDTHGHPQGDALLQSTAASWQGQLRATDLLARYGGDEFAAVIAAWPLQSVVAVVERLREATPDGQTCSAGVARWDGEESASELFARADAALYTAKARGRNRTVATAR